MTFMDSAEIKACPALDAGSRNDKANTCKKPSFRGLTTESIKKVVKINFVALVKSPKSVIPAQAGIYKHLVTLDSRFRGNDDKNQKSDFLRVQQFCYCLINV